MGTSERIIKIYNYKANRYVNTEFYRITINPKSQIQQNNIEVAQKKWYETFNSKYMYNYMWMN